MTTTIKYPKSFICDICGRPIEKPDPGLVWWREKDHIFSDFKIIHNLGSCHKKSDSMLGDGESAKDNKLDELQNDIGLSYFLSLPTKEDANGVRQYRVSPESMYLLNRMICRMFIPGFEENPSKFFNDRLP